MIDDAATLQSLYAAFNERNVSGAVALMAEEVEWANGMDGGYVHGREAVRDYWTKQWAAIQPHVEPLAIERCEGGQTAVEVQQVVRDLDERVRHVFRFCERLVVRFDIENAGGLSALAHD